MSNEEENNLCISDDDRSSTLKSPKNKVKLGKLSKRSSSSLQKPNKENKDDNYVSHENTLKVVQELQNEQKNEKQNKSATSTFTFEELTSDDDIYTFQCPGSYSKEDLCNKIIDFSKLNQLISSNGEQCQLELFDTDKKFITLALPKKSNEGSLIKLPLRGHIVIHKIVNSPDSKIIPEEDKEHKIVFPKDIKVRHPLLGVEWKTHIDLANKILKRVQKKEKKIKKEYEIEKDSFKVTQSDEAVSKGRKRRKIK